MFANIGHTHQVVPPTLVTVWPPDGALFIGGNLVTCIEYKFGHYLARLASVANLATRWRHLDQLQIGSPSGTTCTSSKSVGGTVESHQLIKSAKPLPVQ